MRRLPILLRVVVVFSLVMWGCSSSDPTASDEYAALEEELTQSEARLAEITAEMAVFIDEAYVAAEAAAVLLLDAASSCSSSDSGSELPEGAQAVIDEYLATWQERDIDGWIATVTDDYIYHGHLFNHGSRGEYPGGSVDWGVRERATNIEFKNPQVAEWIGDKLVVGDGPWVVSVRENWVDATVEIRFDGVGTYVIVEQDDGTMKINSHTYAGTGSGTET